MTILTKRPSGDSVVQLIPSAGVTNWNLVDEVVADDTDYVEQDTTLTRYDIYTLDGGTIPDGDIINSVTAYYRCDYVQITLATTVEGRAVLKIGALYYDSPASTLTTSFVTYNSGVTWLLNPATGLAWTQADITALLAGPKLYSGNINRRIPQCSQFYIDVDHSLAPAGGVLRRRLTGLGL